MSICAEKTAIFRMASAYCCASNTPPSELHSLGNLMNRKALDEILQFILNRAGVDRTSQAYQVGRLFCRIAATRVPKATCKSFRKIVKAVNPPLQKKLKKQTFEKLQQIERRDVDQIQRLPLDICSEINVKVHINRNDAVKLATAAALELQLATGLKLGTIARLPLNAIDFHSDPVVLTLSDTEAVTLGKATEFVLSTYIRRSRPWFTSGGKEHLFPGRKASKIAPSMALQIRKLLASRNIKVTLSSDEISKMAGLMIKRLGLSEALSRRFRGTKVPPSRDKLGRSIEGLEATREVNRVVTSLMFKKDDED